MRTPATKGEAFAAYERLAARCLPAWKRAERTEGHATLLREAGNLAEAERLDALAAKHYAAAEEISAAAWAAKQAWIGFRPRPVQGDSTELQYGKRVL